MEFLLQGIFNKNEDAFSRGIAATIFMFCVLFFWELFCTCVALFVSIGPLTFGKAFLYVNIFGFAMLVIAALIGAAVTIAAIKKEKDEEGEDPSEQ